MKRQKIAVFLLSIIILLAPFDYGFFDLQILTINLVLSLLLAFIWLTSAGKNGETGFYINPVVLSICIFTLLCFLSLTYSIHPYSSLTEVMRVWTYLMIFLASANFLSRESFQKIFHLIVIWMCLLAMWGLGEYLFAGEIEPKSVFAYRGSFAAYLLLTVPLAFGLMQNNLRFLYIGVLGLFAFIVSQSRSGWVSLVMGALLLAAAAVKKFRRTDTSLRAGVRASLVITLMFVLLFAFDYLFMSSAIVKRAQTLFSPGDIPSAQARVKYWDSALEITKRYLPTGTGIQTFYLAYPFFKHPSFSGCTHHFVHNDYLQVLCELGPLGLIAFLSIIACYIIILRSKLRKNKDKNILFAIYLSSLTFFFSSIFEFNIYVPSLIILVYLYIAFVSRGEGKFIAIRIRKSALYFLFTFAIVLATFPYIGQTFIKEANTAFEKGNVDTALVNYKRASFFSPLNYLPQERLARIYLIQGRRKNALERCINAIRLNSLKKENHRLLRVILSEEK